MTMVAVRLGFAGRVSPSSRDRPSRGCRPGRDAPDPGSPRNRGAPPSSLRWGYPGVRISWGGEAPPASLTRGGFWKGGVPPLAHMTDRWPLSAFADEVAADFD